MSIAIEESAGAGKIVGIQICSISFAASMRDARMPGPRGYHERKILAVGFR